MTYCKSLDADTSGVKYDSERYKIVAFYDFHNIIIIRE